MRAAVEYVAERPAGAVRLDTDDLLFRPYLLPPRSRPLVLVGGEPDDVRLAVLALQSGGREVRHLPGQTWRRHLAAETGPPTRLHLWEASAALVEALAAYAPAAWTSGAARLSALDVACGSGRNAVYLGLHGFDVTGVDRLPDALAQARDLAAHHAVPLQLLSRDLEVPGALEDLRADLVVVVRYLERSLFPAIESAMLPGGLLVYETFTTEQAELGHPRDPRHLLQPGELRHAFPGLQTLAYQEGFFDGAHLARLVATFPGRRLPRP